MAEKTKMPKRLVPAVRGVFGTWVYYSALINLNDVAVHVKVAEEIHQNKKLSEMIQRELTKKRADEIAEYLCTQSERFLNSLVVAVYGGEPKWYALDDVHSYSTDLELFEIDEDTLASVGFLSLSGEETFFALDGQHRLAGIRKALKKDEDLAEDEINVIFVAHKETTKGRQRTRRLFTTLNKRAKPVSKGAIIALDEDDTMAIICRRLVEEHDWFQGRRIAYQANNNMPSSNQTALTTIGALYDLLSVLFCEVYKANREKLKYYRPSDDELNVWYNRADSFFDSLHEYFPAFSEFCDAEEKYSKVTSKYRNQNGGSALFRPIGLIILVEVLGKLRRIYKDADVDDLLEHIAQISWMLSDPPFIDIIWDPAGRRMVTGTKVLCRDLILYVLGEDHVEDPLVQKYSKVKGLSQEEAMSVIEDYNRLEKFDD